METKLINHLKSLAEKYERKEFLIGDPSWFMHQVDGDTNKELLAFIASSLSYGSRKQFLPKIQSLGLNPASSAEKDANRTMPAPNDNDVNIAEWLISGKYNEVVPPTDECFYRLYTKKTFNSFLSALAEMVNEYGNIKNYLIANMKTKEAIEAIKLLTEWFDSHNSVGVIPKNTNSSCKRVCMFLRWMVRDNSPVDLGIWNDIIDKQTLIIPMDTHVVQEANRFGLLKGTTTSMSSAIKLTNRLKEVFPDDPIKGDFALFGLGIEESDKRQDIGNNKLSSKR